MRKRAVPGGMEALSYNDAFRIVHFLCLKTKQEE